MPGCILGWVRKREAGAGERSPFRMTRKFSGFCKSFSKVTHYTYAGCSGWITDSQKILLSSHLIHFPLPVNVISLREIVFADVAHRKICVCEGFSRENKLRWEVVCELGAAPCHRLGLQMEQKGNKRNPEDIDIFVSTFCLFQAKSLKEARIFSPTFPPSWMLLT